MKNRRFASLIAVTAAGLVSACAPQQVRTPEAPPDPKTATLVMLLPDPDTTTTGRATVSSRATSKATNKPASVELANARESTLIGLNGSATKVTVISEDEVRQQYGSLLSSLPPAPQHFIVYFRFESDELTAESRALVPDILRAVKDRPVPEVVVTGHTDTTGTPPSNRELGMKRATMVRALLADAGLDPTSVEVASHGEAALLVQTPDDTYEPRNRRVEITIR
jgi:outer membrane protein OmpA-like peptidoglycan-associated protein